MIWFEWDPGKDRTNQRKHGIGFEEAAHVFSDPYALFERDRVDGETGELRWRAIGLVEGMILLLVAHTARQEGQDEVIRLISARRAPGRSETAMKKLVRKNLADCKLTSTGKQKLAELVGRPDSEIDLSDIAPLPESFWQNAVRNPFYRPVKQQLTIRLDADVVAWLREQGEGYQTRLNELLRKAMLDDIQKSA